MSLHIYIYLNYLTIWLAQCPLAELRALDLTLCQSLFFTVFFARDISKTVKPIFAKSSWKMANGLQEKSEAFGFWTLSGLGGRLLSLRTIFTKSTRRQNGRKKAVWFWPDNIGPNISTKRWKPRKKFVNGRPDPLKVACCANIGEVYIRRRSPHNIASGRLNRLVENCFVFNLCRPAADPGTKPTVSKHWM